MVGYRIIATTCVCQLLDVLALPNARNENDVARRTSPLIRRDATASLFEASDNEDNKSDDNKKGKNATGNENKAAAKADPNAVNYNDWVSVVPSGKKTHLEVKAGKCYNLSHCVEVTTLEEEKSSAWKVERDDDNTQPVMNGEKILLHGMYADHSHMGNIDTYLRFAPKTCSSAGCFVAAGMNKIGKTYWTVQKLNAKKEPVKPQDTVHLVMEYNGLQWVLSTKAEGCPDENACALASKDAKKKATWHLKKLETEEIVDELNTRMQELDDSSNPFKEDNAAEGDNGRGPGDEESAAVFGIAALAISAVGLSCVYFHYKSTVETPDYAQEAEKHIKTLVTNAGATFTYGQNFGNEAMTGYYEQCETENLRFKERFLGHLVAWKDLPVIFGQGSAGVKAHRYGPTGGGISTINIPISELGWEAGGGGAWAETLGRELVGDKWESFADGGIQAEKREVLLLLKVKKTVVDGLPAADDRPSVTILPTSQLQFVGDAYYFPLSGVASVLILTPFIASSFGKKFAEKEEPDK